MHGRVNFFHSEKTLPFFDFDHREEMKFTYALSNEYFFGHKLWLAADFAVVTGPVIGRRSAPSGFFILHKPNNSAWAFHSSKDNFKM